MTERVVPFADRDSAPWWAALARHVLVQQRCSNCERWRWPARAMCGECGSFSWSWQPVPETGTVVSWITTHHAFLPGFDAPYHTVFVALTAQDDIVMPGTWFGAEPPATGMAVRAHYDDVAQTDGAPVTLLGWEPAERDTQGPSGPAERVAQGPSGPAERVAQGPSGPAEREIREG